MTRTELAWLAGLLEGEGSFCKGPPSAPNQPRIAIEMTDYDVIWKVAKLFGTTYIHASNDSRNPRWKKAYLVILRGRRGIDLMRRLRPFMGARRRRQIDAAVRSYKSLRPGDNKRKLTRRQVGSIRRRLKEESAASLAREFGVSHFTVRQIRDGKTWRE